MKNLSFLIMFAWLSAMPIMAQVNPVPTPGYDPGEFDRLMQKSKILKKAGWWMLGGGAVLAAGGAIWAYQTVETSSTGDDDELTEGVNMFFAGIISMGSSVPVFINAGKARKKAQLVAGSQPLSLGWKTGRQQPIPSLSLQIPLGR